MRLIMYSFTQPFCFLCIDFISTLCYMEMIFQDSSYQMELCGIQFPADFGLHLLHLLCVCSLLCTCVQKYWKGTMEFQVSSWHIHSKGTGKRGHIVADTNVSPFTRAQHLLRIQILCSGHKNVSDFVQKHFVSATNVSQFARARERHEQQCFHNNVSSFASSLSLFTSRHAFAICNCYFLSCKKTDNSLHLSQIYPWTIVQKISLIFFKSIGGWYSLQHAGSFEISPSISIGNSQGIFRT